MNLLKSIIFFVLIGLLFLPIIQNNIHLLNLKPLMGFFTKIEKPKFSFDKWLSGEYQINYEKNLEENIGFKPFFVRVNNQIKFTLFDIIKTKLTVLGKNNHLFQSDYIDAYMGFDFVGKDSVKLGIDRLNYIQHKLKEIGIEFILVFAPGKAFFMPENIPTQYKTNQRTNTNYDVYVSYLHQSNINFIDFSKYFISIKDTSKYPLYPVNGTHWSGYGCSIATDSLTKYISKLMNIKMVEQKDLGGYITNTEMRWSDDELAKQMNIFQDKVNLDMYYPNISYFSNNNTVRPKVLFVGDSYVQGLYRFYPYLDSTFNKNSSFWSYSYLVKWSNQKRINYDSYVRDLNIEEEVFSKNLIVILISELNIKLLGSLFTERFYNLLKGRENKKILLNLKNENYSDKSLNNSEIKIQIEKIRKNKEWFEKVKQQAVERNIPIEEMLVRSAKYFISNKKK